MTLSNMSHLHWLTHWRVTMSILSYMISGQQKAKHWDTYSRSVCRWLEESEYVLDRLKTFTYEVM